MNPTKHKYKDIQNYYLANPNLRLEDIAVKFNYSTSYLSIILSRITKTANPGKRKEKALEVEREKLSTSLESFLERIQAYRDGLMDYLCKECPIDKRNNNFGGINRMDAILKS